MNKEVEQIIQNHTQYQDTLTEDTLLDIFDCRFRGLLQCRVKG